MSSYDSTILWNERLRIIRKTRFAGSRSLHNNNNNKIYLCFLGMEQLPLVWGSFFACLEKRWN